MQRRNRPTDAPCQHCGRTPSNARGLCRGCFNNARIRRCYPLTSVTIDEEDRRYCEPIDAETVHCVAAPKCRNTVRISAGRMAWCKKLRCCWAVCDDCRRTVEKLRDYRDDARDC